MRSIGKMRAKCSYYPSFAVGVADIGDTGNPMVNLLGHAGKDERLFQALFNQLFVSWLSH